MKLAVVMDALEKIHYTKDSTVAMLCEAQKRQFEIFYITQQKLYFRDNQAFANCNKLTIVGEKDLRIELGKNVQCLLQTFDVILMRKDPPFNIDYIYTTYLLEHATRLGVLVINHPRSLRDANEKLFTLAFPQCCPPTLVTSEIKLLREFLSQQQDIVCKPLDAMGGASVFRIKDRDENASVIFEVLTKNENRLIVAQRYIPEIKAGDKRILLINGEPIPYALARIPSPGELRGNLVAGAKAVAQLLTERDKWICTEVGPILRKKGLYFVGLDIIGDYLTEINVTSPTGIRELDQQMNLSISAQLFDFIESVYQGK